MSDPCPFDINSLYTDALHSIFDWFTLRERGIVSSVSKRWKDIALTGVPRGHLDMLDVVGWEKFWLVRNSSVCQHHLSDLHTEWNIRIVELIIDMRNLRHLYISGRKNTLTNWMISILATKQRLETLCLSQFALNNTQLLEALFASGVIFSRLRHVGKIKLTRALLDLLGVHAPMLQTLHGIVDVVHSRSVLQCISTRLQPLQELKLAVDQVGSEYYRNTTLSACDFAASMDTSQLRVLALQHFDLDASLMVWLQNAPHLTTLTAYMCSRSLPDMSAFVHPTLRTFDVHLMLPMMSLLPVRWNEAFRPQHMPQTTINVCSSDYKTIF
jgi:hypothetical protein